MGTLRALAIQTEHILIEPAAGGFAAFAEDLLNLEPAFLPAFLDGLRWIRRKRRRAAAWRVGRARNGTKGRHCRVALVQIRRKHLMAWVTNQTKGRAQPATADKAHWKTHFSNSLSSSASEPLPSSSSSSSSSSLLYTSA